MNSLKGINQQITKARQFFGCSKLIHVKFQNINFISNSMFDNCHQLTTIDIPKVTLVSEYAFI